VTLPSPPIVPSSPAHGTTKIDRRSSRTGTTAAMSLRTLCHGTVMWMPLAGRMLPGWLPSSSARTSSAQTPVALTTARARTSTSPLAPAASVPSPPVPAPPVPAAPVETTAPVTRPPDLRMAVTVAWFTTVAPKSSAAVRATVSVSRASSVWAS
jgi:hypothetical protein